MRSCGVALPVSSLSLLFTHPREHGKINCSLIGERKGLVSLFCWDICERSASTNRAMCSPALLADVSLPCATSPPPASAQILFRLRLHFSSTCLLRIRTPSSPSSNDRQRTRSPTYF